MDDCYHTNPESMLESQHCVTLPVTLLQEAALPAASLVPVPWVACPLGGGSPAHQSPQVLDFAMLISCPPGPEERRLGSPLDSPPSSLHRPGICQRRKLLRIREHLKMNIFYPSQPARGVWLQIAEGCVIDSDSGHIWHPAWSQRLWPRHLFFVVILG